MYNWDMLKEMNSTELAMLIWRIETELMLRDYEFTTKYHPETMWERD